MANAWSKLLRPAKSSQPSPSESVAKGTPENTASEGTIEAVDSTSFADTADFDDLFHGLGYTENDPYWTVPKDWLMEDGSDPGYQLMSDQEIVETIVLDREDSDSDNEEPSPPSKSVTYTQACAAFECALEWLESQGDTDPAHLMLVKNWRDLAAQHRVQAAKQKQIYLICTFKKHSKL